MIPNIAPIAAGYLPAATANGDKSQSVIGATAIKQVTAGLWFVTMPEPYDPTIHIVLAWVALFSTTDVLQVVSGLSGTGFSLQSAQGAAIPLTATNQGIVFAVFKLPRDK